MSTLQCSFLHTPSLWKPMKFEIWKYIFNFVRSHHQLRSCIIMCFDCSSTQTSIRFSRKKDRSRERTTRSSYRQPTSNVMSGNNGTVRVALVIYFVIASIQLTFNVKRHGSGNEESVTELSVSKIQTDKNYLLLSSLTHFSTNGTQLLKCPLHFKK